MRINRSILNPKYFTCKEWRRFNKVVEREDGNDITAQEILLKKYDVILTDYKVKPRINNKDYYFDLNGIERIDPSLTKKELALKIGKVIYKNANMNNFNKGMKIFNEGMKNFNDSISAVTKELGNNTKSQNKLWSKKTKQTPIWSEQKPKRRYKKRKSVQKDWDQRERNLERLFGKRRKFKL